MHLALSSSELILFGPRNTALDTSMMELLDAVVASEWKLVGVKLIPNPCKANGFCLILLLFALWNLSHGTQDILLLTMAGISAPSVSTQQQL